MKTSLKEFRTYPLWRWIALAVPPLLLGSAIEQFRCAAAAQNGAASAADPMSWLSISNTWGATSVDQLQKLAESNQGAAQYFLGWRYEFGRDVPKDVTQASKLYRAAAEQGFAPAEFLMGSRAEHQSELQGQTVVGNYQVASEWYEKAANHGYVPAMVHLGNLYYYGKLQRDNNAALKWFQLAAQKGNQEAILQLGELYRYNRGDLLQNHAESAKWFRIAAENGSAEGQYQLALLLLEGEGIPHDPQQARQWLEKSAAHGHTEAIVKLSTLQGGTRGLDQFSRQDLKSLALANLGPARLALATDYEQGLKGPPDLSQAAGLYWDILSQNPILDKGLATNIDEAAHRLVGLYAMQKLEPHPPASAATQDADGFPDYYVLMAPKSPDELARRLQSSQTIFTRPDDQLRIAEMFYTGKIVPENWTEAVNWFLKAAKAGNADAINRIGELWAAGVDGAPDGKEAARWFRRAATKGCLAAQLNLARAYEKGDGVDHDLVQAWVWLKTAADAGAPSATAELQQIQAQLSPEQLQQAKNSLRK